MSERHLAELLDTQRVRDRAVRLLRRPGDELAASQRIPGVRGEFRLDADDRGARAPGADRRGDPGDQPAAADRHDDEVHVRKLLGYLEPDRALSGDHLAVVERRDDKVPVLGGQPGGYGEPRGERRRTPYQLRAVALDRVGLRPGRGLRHHHNRVHAEQRGGIRDRVPVIAARVRHDAVFPGLVEPGGDRGVRSPQLERARWLQRLRLDQQARCDPRHRYKRCAHGHSGKTVRGVLDLRYRDKISHPSIVRSGMTHRDERPAIVTDREQALSRTA